VSGFVAAHREALEHPLFVGDSARLGAWFWMIAKACWKPTRFNVHGKTIELNRSQFCCSVRELADAWGWSKSSVDRFLTRLKTETMIETESGTGRLVITILNYDKYQTFEHEAGTPSGTPSGTAAGQQRDIKEQGNKGTIEEEPNGSSPPIPPKPTRKPSSRKVSMTLDWLPTDLGGDVGRLLEVWPPGRLDAEIADFREYWFENGEKRPGWDRTFRSRIRTIHDRVMRESRNAGHSNGSGSNTPRDRRDAAERYLDERMERTGSFRAS